MGGMTLWPQLPAGQRPSQTMGVSVRFRSCRTDGPESGQCPAPASRSGMRCRRLGTGCPFGAGGRDASGGRVRFSVLALDSWVSWIFWIFRVSLLSPWGFRKPHQNREPGGAKPPLPPKVLEGWRACFGWRSLKTASPSIALTWLSVLSPPSQVPRSANLCWFGWLPAASPFARRALSGERKSLPVESILIAGFALLGLRKAENWKLSRSGNENRLSTRRDFSLERAAPYA